MAPNTKVVLLAALMGSTLPAGSWAQTATATPETTPAATAETTAPAADASADAAATPAAPVATTESAPATTPAATPATTAVIGSDAAAGTAPAPTTEAPGSAAAPAAGASPATNTLAAPAATAEAAEVGGFYLDSTQGDWQVRCQKTADGKDPCELYQLLKDKGGNPVAEASLIPLGGKAAAGVTLVAPLETDLLPGLGFKVDDGKQIAYPFSFCAPVGCVSRVAMTQAELDTMRKGNAATVSLVPYGAPKDTRVDLALSLKGFTAGWDAVKAKTPAATPVTPAAN